MLELLTDSLPFEMPALAHCTPGHEQYDAPDIQPTLTPLVFQLVQLVATAKSNKALHCTGSSVPPLAGVLQALLRLPFQTTGQFWYKLARAVF
jgi:hypothetical protein